MQKSEKGQKQTYFFRTCHITRRGIGHLIGSWQCLAKVWPQTSDGILNTLRHCLASYPLILILTDFHVHCNKMLLSFERGFIFLVYCFIAESIAPVNVPPLHFTLHSATQKCSSSPPCDGCCFMRIINFIVTLNKLCAINTWKHRPTYSRDNGTNCPVKLRFKLIPAFTHITLLCLSFYEDEDEDSGELFWTKCWCQYFVDCYRNRTQDWH